MIQALIKYHIVRLKNGPELYQLLLKVEWSVLNLPELIIGQN
jgi:hypothetical protein